MEDESWRTMIPLLKTGAPAKHNPETVALYLTHHAELRNRRDLTPQFVRLVMHSERCGAPLTMIEPMLFMHLWHLNKDG